MVSDHVSCQWSVVAGGQGRKVDGRLWIGVHGSEWLVVVGLDFGMWSPGAKIFFSGTWCNPLQLSATQCNGSGVCCSGVAGVLRQVLQWVAAGNEVLRSRTGRTGRTSLTGLQWPFLVF